MPLRHAKCPGRYARRAEKVRAAARRRTAAGGRRPVGRVGWAALGGPRGGGGGARAGGGGRVGGAALGGPRGGGRAARAEGFARAAAREAPPLVRSPYGVVVERVKVSVFAYVPVRSGSLAPIACLNCSGTTSLDFGALYA